MHGLVSIIMPSYNTATYIAASIKSVLAQTYANWELLIVDDCSTDNTDEIVKPFLADKRIKYLKNEQNSGAAITRNRALREAKGEWIAFLDSDDLWHPQKLEKQLTFMITNHYDFSYTDYRICLNGTWLPFINTAPKKITKVTIYNYCYFSTITVIYNQKKVGLVQVPDLRKNNDYALWLKIIPRCGIAYRLPECLSYYIKHENSISSGKKWKLIKWHYVLFRKVLHTGPFLSTLFTINNLIHGIWKKFYYKTPVSSAPILNVHQEI